MDWEQAITQYCKVNEAPKQTEHDLEIRVYLFLTNLKHAIDSGTERIGAGREQELDELLRALNR